MDNAFDVVAARKELGLSQAELAGKLRLDQSTVSNWETGKSECGGPARIVIEGMLERHRTQDAAA